MKVYTNNNNSSTLKVLISANYACKSVDIQTVPVNDARFQSPQRLPVIHFDSGITIFSSNVAARLLYGPSAETDVVDQWLEWEALKLQPAVVACANSGKSDICNDVLVQLLLELESSLKDREYLVKDTISAADIVIWSCLFPLATDTKLSKEWLAERKSIRDWFSRLQNLQHFKDAVKKLGITEGIQSLQSLSNALWFPSGASSQQVPEKSKKIPQSNIIQASMSSEAPTKDVPVTDKELAAAEDAWKNGLARRPECKSSKTPVLPKVGEKNILITSALPYVNNVPHLGNIIGCVLSADVFARFCRLSNYNTLFICGTDEYGTATETKALEEGLTPQQICDKYFKIHDAIYKWFNISFDHFGRTTTPEQTKICQEMFLQLRYNGFTSTQTVEQLLCEKCDRFLADRFVEGTCPFCKFEDARGDQCDGCGHLINAIELISPRCKMCQQTPIVKPSEQLFLELPEIEPLIRNWIKKVHDNWSNNAKVIANSWLKEGLKPRCITRDLKWGIPVPLEGYSNKVFYVWFDAPIGYMSITMNYTTEWKQWWQPTENARVKLYQFMAKDNVPFHSIMFPATLLGANKGYTTVDCIMATEYLNYEDGKFSKSRGVGVFGSDAQDTGIPADVWRFYLLYMRPESQDSSFSWVDLATKNNSELLNNLGNFVYRALAFAEKFFNNEIPIMEPSATDFTVLALVTRELKAYKAALEKAKLRDGLKYILSISRHGNQYMQSQQPWFLVKGSDKDKKQAATVVGICCNIACLLSILLHPYMPNTWKIMQEQMNASSSVNVITEEVSILLPTGHKLGKSTPLFEKIEMSNIEQLKEKFSGGHKSVATESNRKQQADVQHVACDSAHAVAHLEAAIAKQGELVRSLKSSGKPKAEWQPHVNVLLELKKQLQAAQDLNNQPQQLDVSEISRLEEEVAKQGALVRQMKEGGRAKAEWQPEVNKLLDLKSKLATAQGNPLPSTKGKGKSKK